MVRFALYARTSTEDNQAPADSLGWQRSRAEGLIAGHGKIVETFHDVGQSRTVPWKRRPEATRLLALFGDARRPFDAVVIGEPQRAFAGNEFGLVFPLFQHHGVELWVPEIGGRVDPGSEAHDLVMMLFGGMSKGERNRIKVRVRTSMLEQAHREGRFLGGRPPYGYQLADAGPHPKASKAQRGQRLHRLEPDPVAGPVVGRIFREYVAGKGLGSIAEGLTRDGVLSPSGHDPARNPHRQGTNGAWSRGAIRAILRNPRYLGYSVWNKARREEVLVDPEDVTLGHESRQRWNDRSAWVWSQEPTHEPLVDADTFAKAEARLRSPKQRRPRKPKAGRVYALRGVLYCALCDRRMEGHWHKKAPWYRCRFRQEYAAQDHPANIYLREGAVTPALDEWIMTLFDPKHVDDTCRLLAEASADEEMEHRADRARTTLAEAERKLKKYKATLDAGGDPLVVARWLKETEQERQVATEELRAYEASSGALTPAAVRKMVKAAGPAIRRQLAKATPKQRAALYGDLGLKLLYYPEERQVLAEAWPGRGDVGVGGGT